MTHWRNGSATTGQPSSMPTSSRSHARSASVVCGVMRSTIELGNVHAVSTKRASSALRASQTVVTARARHAAVARQVVAAQDRQRSPAADAAGVEPARDRLDRRVGLLERVAALGDRHRQDGDLRIGDPARERILVGDRERIVDDAPDDLRARSLAVALDQRVEVILRREHARHAPIGLEPPEPADAPVATLRRELVDIEGEVRAMEPADAEVEDARSQRRAVVARSRHAQRLDAFERGCGETVHRRAHPRRGYQAPSSLARHRTARSAPREASAGDEGDHAIGDQPHLLGERRQARGSRCRPRRAGSPRRRARVRRG